MTKRSTFAKAAVAAAAGAMALGAAASAAAQPYGEYGYYGSGGYDPCRRDSNNRGVVGALLGGALGASVGANAAARNARQDGALLGGAVGAIAGAAIGKNGAGCTGSAYAPPPPPPAPNAYYGDHQRYGYNGYERDYYGRDGSHRRYDGRYSDDAWAYGRRGERYRIAERAVGDDGCTLAESPIYMPDGRTQTRFVRVCMDSRGRYQVVD